MSHVARFKPIKRKSAQTAVLSRMASVPVQERAGTRILDVPAGSGVVTIPLSLAGFDVTGCDLFPEYGRAALADLTARGGAEVLLDQNGDYIPAAVRTRLFDQCEPAMAREVSFVPGDMEKRLPFDDGSFDVVASIEGIEHTDMQEHFIRELRRVLKPGGRLLLSTPNILCLRSRFAYALTGQRTLKTFIDEHTSVHDKDKGRVYHGHVFLASYFQLRYLLHNNGFHITDLLSSGCSATSVLLAPLMLPLTALFTLLAQARWKRKFHKLIADGRIPQGTQPPYREIGRHVLSRQALFSGTLILEAEAVA